jgi:hypothetical protein
MPTASDLVQLTSIFSGGQLVVVAFLFLELRSMKENLKEVKAEVTKQDAAVTALIASVAKLQGRLDAKD